MRHEVKFGTQVELWKIYAVLAIMCVVLMVIILLIAGPGDFRDVFASLAFMGAWLSAFHAIFAYKQRTKGD